MTNYLPLTDYSSKYKVSLSTLRRRIKAEDIQFMFEDGRYLVLDEPMGSHQRLHRPSHKVEDTLVSAPYNAPVVKEMAPSFGSGAGPGERRASEDSGAPAALNETTLSTKAGEEPILTAANRLLTELKKAYTQILQEKEEQILHLKEEVADLKTLVRVLESENERLKKDLF